MRSVGLGFLLVLQMEQAPRPASAAERGAAGEIVEQFRRGEDAWRASCPKPSEDGGCVALRGNPHRPRLFAIDRDPALVAESRRRFLTVAKLWRRLGGGEISGASESAHPRRAPSAHADYATIFRADPEEMAPRASSVTRASTVADPDQAGAAHAAAGVAFYLAEEQWEAFIRIGPPRDPILSRYPPDTDLVIEKARTQDRQSQRRLAAFVARKLDQLARTRQMYLTLLGMSEAPFDIAATARIGQLYQAFDDAIPSEQLDDKAVVAFKRCFDMGAKNARYDEWFRLCEHELTVLRPFEFPKVNERLPEASDAANPVVPVPVITRLE